MSLPSSESLPADIQELTPARQRHLRRLPRSATPAERALLLSSLLTLTAPTPAYFLLSLAGALTGGLAVYLSEPRLLLLMIVILPFNSPLFSLSLTPMTGSFGSSVRAVLSLAIHISLAVASGLLVGWLSPEKSLPSLPVSYFNSISWFNLILLAGSALIASLIILRRARIPRLLGVLINFEVHLPFMIAGYSLLTGQLPLFSEVLLVGISHLLLALAISMLTFLALGLIPQSGRGWLSAVVGILLAGVLIAAALLLPRLHSAGDAQPETSVPTVLDTPTQEASPLEIVAPTATLSATSTSTPKPSPTPSLTQPATRTSTAKPTTFIAVVITAEGAVIREAPAFDSLVISYLNGGDQVEILAMQSVGNSRWYQVRIQPGQTGWLLAALVQTQTPSPSPASP